MLSAIGTAAALRSSPPIEQLTELPLAMLDVAAAGDECDAADDAFAVEPDATAADACRQQQQQLHAIPAAAGAHSERETSALLRRSCEILHAPYNAETAPFPIALHRCALCRQGLVPDVLFASIDPPAELCTAGRPVLIQVRCDQTMDHSLFFSDTHTLSLIHMKLPINRAPECSYVDCRVMRPKRETKGEAMAIEISEVFVRPSTSRRVPFHVTLSLPFEITVQ